MKVLVIGKANYNYILPLQEFPKDGDKFYIDNSIKCVNDFDTPPTTVYPDLEHNLYNSYGFSCPFECKIFLNLPNVAISTRLSS